MSYLAGAAETKYLAGAETKYLDGAAETKYLAGAETKYLAGAETNLFFPRN